MFSNNHQSVQSDNNAEIFPISIKRLTALWGFSEAAFGGILHALRIPFTGIFLGGAAVIFITLIAHYSKEKSAILRSTLIVILVKAFVSPYSPLTAYFAVALQGILGYLFFNWIRFERVSALLLGFFSLLFSALQKLILLTLLFGTGLWKSIDLFVDFVLTQIPVIKYSPTFSFSLFIIGIYTGIHIISGIYAGLKAAQIPEWISHKSKSFERSKLKAHYDDDLFSGKKSRKRRSWWKKKSAIFLYGFLMVSMVLSFFFPQLGKNRVYEVLFMLIRSIAITVIWFSVLSPFIVKHFKKFLERNNFKHASEINDITTLFPGFRSIINICWKLSQSYKGVKRIRNFLSDSLALLLFADLNK